MFVVFFFGVFFRGKRCCDDNINFQEFSILITLISAAVMVLASDITPIPDNEYIKDLTFATASADDKARTAASWAAKDVIFSCVVVVFIIGAYLYFTG